MGKALSFTLLLFISVVPAAVLADAASLQNAEYQADGKKNLMEQKQRALMVAERAAENAETSYALAKGEAEFAEKNEPGSDNAKNLREAAQTAFKEASDKQAEAKTAKTEFDNAEKAWTDAEATLKTEIGNVQAKCTADYSAAKKSCEEANTSIGALEKHSISITGKLKRNVTTPALRCQMLNEASAESSAPPKEKDTAAASMQKCETEISQCTEICMLPLPRGNKQPHNAHACGPSPGKDRVKLAVKATEDFEKTIPNQAKGVCGDPGSDPLAKADGKVAKFMDAYSNCLPSNCSAENRAHFERVKAETGILSMGAGPGGNGTTIKFADGTERAYSQEALAEKTGFKAYSQGGNAIPIQASTYDSLASNPLTSPGTFNLAPNGGDLNTDMSVIAPGSRFSGTPVAPHLTTAEPPSAAPRAAPKAAPGGGSGNTPSSGNAGGNKAADAPKGGAGGMPSMPGGGGATPETAAADPNAGKMPAELLNQLNQPAANQCAEGEVLERNTCVKARARNIGDAEDAVDAKVDGGALTVRERIGAAFDALMGGKGSDVASSKVNVGRSGSGVRGSGGSGNGKGAGAGSLKAAPTPTGAQGFFAAVGRALGFGGKKSPAVKNNSKQAAQVRPGFQPPGFGQASDAPMNYDRFLPKMAANGARRVAGAQAHPEIAGRHEDIFQNVSRAYRNNGAMLSPVFKTAFKY